MAIPAVQADPYEHSHDAYEELLGEVWRQERILRIEERIDAEIQRDARLAQRPAADAGRDRPRSRRPNSRRRG